MITQFYVDNADNIKCTLTVTMTLGEWKAMRENLSDTNAEWKLKNEIYDMINQAEQVYRPKENDQCNSA